ncbi:hypothetical protein [Mycolicibacterium sp. PDY-3]|uniref:hypothetical protein n=1 Tax=Mycolicibacterium sp. PDY-3 TaxID=3376069 RepID=UPI003788D1F8
MTTPALIIMITMLAINGICLVGLDRAPARGITLGPDDEEEGLYPVIGPPAVWRRLWRPTCLYGAVASAIAAAVAPVLLS